MSERRIKIRRVPYPYKAMLAICSDLDETPDADSYFGLMKFLNSTADTPCGKGLGLEVGNSIYFDMPGDQFSYWNTDDASRDKVQTLIKSGYIDCLHSFGDHATSRVHIERAYSELEQNNCRIKVWIDHAVAPTNFGADIMHGCGDLQGNPAYHADLAFHHGIRYVWIGRVTSVIGQDRPFSLRGIASWRHPVRSADTLLKEFIKHHLGKLRAKYRMHAENALLRPYVLRDGNTAMEFIRCNPHWGGVSSCDRGDGIYDVITKRFLERLIRRGTASIVYTHLGKVAHPLEECPLDSSALQAFRLLAEYQSSGKVLVTTTRKLLDYHNMKRRIHSIVESSCGQEIQIGMDTLGIDDAELPVMLQGLTVCASGNVDRILVNDKNIEGIQKIPADASGGGSGIMVPWKKLRFPEIGK